MKKILIMMLLALPLGVGAEDLAAEDAALLESLAIPIHPDAMYVYGNRETGMRFASNTAVDEIRQWYIEQLGEWSVMNEFGLWALYDGPEGADFGTVMMASQVTVGENEELPGWHSLDDDMTTEIVIQVAK